MERNYIFLVYNIPENLKYKFRKYEKSLKKLELIELNST